MSEVSLRDVLEAEKLAQERVRRAGEEADKIREQAAGEAARIESEASERMENTRRDLLQRSEREVAEIRQSVLKAAEAEMRDWEERCRTGRDAAVEKICRILKREQS